MASGFSHTSILEEIIKHFENTHYCLNGINNYILNLSLNVLVAEGAVAAGTEAQFSQHSIHRFERVHPQGQPVPRPQLLTADSFRLFLLRGKSISQFRLSRCSTRGESGDLWTQVSETALIKFRT